MPGWAQEILDNLAAGKRETFTDYSLPSEAQGAGLWEAPRGALGHWNHIQGGRIANYQIVTPTCWNISPRDGRGLPGPSNKRRSARPWPTPSGRWRCCAWRTRSIPAWHAPFT